MILEEALKHRTALIRSKMQSIEEALRQAEEAASHGVASSLNGTPVVSIIDTYFDIVAMQALLLKTQAESMKHTLTEYGVVRR